MVHEIPWQEDLVISECLLDRDILGSEAGKW